ncbi:hypothetical protein [Pseudonocardia sp. ICBG1293]|uniref:hypothetical protein n=1 Tax=Pseudonocardia sp. ICBG1293 TaxID=2844382 RepID=UPI00272E30D6|nr:hypothetical protein [Pseudonocardia sp. ICBG1293]
MSDRLSGVHTERERILADARADAEQTLSAARAEADALLRDAEQGAGERRSTVVRDVERLAALRDEVRGELTRVQRSLAEELDREPVSAALDDALFGPRPSTRRSRRPGRPRTRTPWPRCRSWAAGRRWSPPAPAPPTTVPPTTWRRPSPLAGPRSRASPGRGGPGRHHRRPHPADLAHLDRVLPFGDLGTGRDQARTRTDVAGGTTRTGRGATRVRARGDARDNRIVMCTRPPQNA